MSKKRRAPFVALATLLGRKCPGAGDPGSLVASGRVLVNGAPVSNPHALVRADASVRVLAPRALRGTAKLTLALEYLGLEIVGCCALDLGAAAGGFTAALLDAGARPVYAVDAGVGQLRGSLRLDPRVVNLERTNLAELGPHLIARRVDFVTADLSYLPLAEAIPQFDRIPLASPARALVLVKPTFELRAGTLADSPSSVAGAVGAVEAAFARSGWTTLEAFESGFRGTRGAAEAFVYARRGGGSEPKSRSVAGSGTPPK